MTTVREATTPLLVPPPTSGGLADSLYRTADRDPDLVLYQVRTGDGWRDVTAARLRAEVVAVARGLVAAGIEPGDRIGLMSRNRYEWAVADYAIASIGAVLVPLYPTSSAAQIQWILADSGAVGCFVETDEHAELLASVRSELPRLTACWRLTELAALAEAGQRVSESIVDERRAAVMPDSLSSIVYTSGTTGHPKGCVLTHANFVTEADNAVELLYPVFRSVTGEVARTVLFLPLAHVFGRLVQVAALRAEVCVGHAPSVRPDDLRPDLLSFQPTFLLGVPYVFEKIYHTARATAAEMGRQAAFDRAARVATRYAEAVEAQIHGTGPGPGLALRALHALYDRLVYRQIRAALGGRMRNAMCGSAMLGRRLSLFYAGAGITIYEGYGLTETTAAVTVNPPLAPRFGTVGRPLPGVTVRIADDGEVLLRGPQVFSGYWRDAGDPPRDGWVATGDLGELDADGYLTITGRAKELIVTSGGKNVAPGPLEDAVRADPLISQCLVIGEGRPYVTALITVDNDGLAAWRRQNPDGDLTAAVQRAVDTANRTVSRAESIRRFRLLDKDFTEADGLLTPTLKMRREQICEVYADEIAELYRA